MQVTLIIIQPKAVNQQKNVEACLICSPQASQTKILLRNLMHQLHLQKNKILNSTLEKAQYQSKIDKSQTALTRLINFVFCDSIIQQNAHLECPHTIFVELLVEVLKCEEKIINYAAQYVFDAMVRRNYELDVLSNQVKEFGRTILAQSLKQADEKDLKQKLKCEIVNSSAKDSNITSEQLEIAAVSQPVVYQPNFTDVQHHTGFFPYYMPILQYPYYP